MEDFNRLYDIANKMVKEIKIEEHTYVGEVVAVAITSTGAIYTGKSIKTTCSLGICAEITLIANMITKGESEIKKLVVVYEGGKIISPCGKCREFLYQINHKNVNCEILIEKDKVVLLKELLPYVWSDMKR